MRATELPFNQRITLPKSVNESMEIKMQDLKEELKKITSEVKAVIGTVGNLTSKQWRVIISLVRRVKDKKLAAGVSTGHVDRINDNMIASNCSAPPFCVLRMDHKVHDDEVVGPPSRPSRVWCQFII